MVVHISLKATWGTLASPNLCGFYDEFGKNVKQTSIRTETKQLILSSQKPSEAVKESSLPSSSPFPAAAPKTLPPPLARGKVIWVYVNLREGPGIQYKIIGRAYMKNTFEILAENSNWLQVRLENGKEGWMSKKAASESSMTSSSQSPPASSHDSSKTRSSSRPPCPM